jgi:alpha-1,3-glucosyltransferase
VYFCFLLKHYCFGSIKHFIQNVAKLGIVVLTVSAISFGPFIDHLPQVISRLFPFKRGLTHAYWAPNFWALYNFVDKVLSIVMKIPQETSSTGGLVQEVKHSVLPSVPPIATFVVLLVAIAPCCLKVFVTSVESPRTFMKPLIICAASSFMFGWHVHEKAILMILIPLQVLSFHEKSESGMSLFTAIFGLYSLTPLLFTHELTLVKLSLFIAYIAFNIFAFQSMNIGRLNLLEKMYSCGIVFLPVYEHCLQYLLNFHQKLPFLPLMLTSVYCSIGMIYFWLKFYCEYILDENTARKKMK